jgi:hypothetical protein
MKKVQEGIVSNEDIKIGDLYQLKLNSNYTLFTLNSNEKEEIEQEKEEVHVEIQKEVHRIENSILPNPDFKPEIGDNVSLSFTQEDKETTTNETYRFVVSNGSREFGLQVDPTNANRFHIIELDTTTHTPLNDTKLTFSNLNPSGFSIDDEFIYLSSVNINNSGFNKTILIDLSNNQATAIGGGWSYDGILHPTGVTSDDKYVYIPSGKSNYIRVYEKAYIKANWKTLGNDTKAICAYIQTPGTIPHSNTAITPMVSINDKLYVTYSGSSMIYIYDVSDLSSHIKTNPKTYDKAISLPFSNATSIENLILLDDKVIIKTGLAMYIYNKDNFTSLNLNEFEYSIEVDQNEYSLFKIETNDEIVSLYTCIKDQAISKVTLQANKLMVVDKPLTNIKATALLKTNDESFKEGDSDESRAVRVRLRQPITVTYSDGILSIDSYFMEYLNNAKITARIKGIQEDIIILDHSDLTIQPFMKNTYNLKLSGVFESVGGHKIEIEKINPKDIISFNIMHDNRTLSILNNLQTEWSISFSGREYTPEECEIIANTANKNDLPAYMRAEINPSTKNARYVRIKREYAKNYIQVMSNLAYTFASAQMISCLEHFSFLTRSIFIQDTNGHDGPQIRWWHFDMTDPYYDPNHKKEFLDRVGVTLDKNSHWSLSVDTRQVGVASSGGANGGGWLGMSDYAFNQSGENVVSYMIAHEFGHSRGWNHGTSFAYGTFSDNPRQGQYPDALYNLLPSLATTLLHMKVLPYIDQFENRGDYLALDQLEAKVYVSNKQDWWDEELWNHVQRKVAAITEYCDEIDNNKAAQIETLQERLAFVRNHWEEWKARTKRNNLIQWRNESQEDPDLQWMRENMPGRSGRYPTYWDEFNETYGSGVPFDRIETKAMNALSTKFNRNSLLNPRGYSSSLEFKIADVSYCGHEGHSLTSKDRLA